MQNYSPLCFKFYALGKKTRRQNIPDQMVAGIRCVQPALTFFMTAFRDLLWLFTNV